MPHAGLMRERELGDQESYLLRARLHMRGGVRRLRQGKVAAGIVTLYDALEAGLQWNVADPMRREAAGIEDGNVPKDEKKLFHMLVKSGVITAPFDYDAFEAVVEEALQREMPDFDYAVLLRSIESIMHDLGVMPFNEARLPPEDPSTY